MLCLVRFQGTSAFVMHLVFSLAKLKDQHWMRSNLAILSSFSSLGDTKQLHVLDTLKPEWGEGPNASLDPTVERSCACAVTSLFSVALSQCESEMWWWLTSGSSEPLQKPNSLCLALFLSLWPAAKNSIARPLCASGGQIPTGG